MKRFSILLNRYVEVPDPEPEVEPPDPIAEFDAKLQAVESDWHEKLEQALEDQRQKMEAERLAELDRQQAEMIDGMAVFMQEVESQTLLEASRMYQESEAQLLMEAAMLVQPQQAQQIDLSPLRADIAALRQDKPQQAPKYRMVMHRDAADLLREITLEPV